MPTDDVQLGAYVYCASHVGPHSTGWCGVSLSQKVGLLAADAAEAEEMVKFFGWPIYGTCPVCYECTANKVHSICQTHTAAEYAGATRRREDLRQYLRDRELDKLDKTA